MGSEKMPDRSAVRVLFKEQLENEAHAIAEELELVKRGDFLVWWYFRRIAGLEDAEIEEIICDGPNDLGIDAIRIDDDSFVHFYQFKNLEDLNSAYPGGHVDKVLAGLNIIIQQRHSSIANEELRGRVEEIYQTVPAGYQLHLVTSGTSISNEPREKLRAFVDSLGGPSNDFFVWNLEDLAWLQDTFYQQSLPTVEEPIEFELQYAPYQVRSADHDCYVFHLTGEKLASVYDQHGEQLLQQNIRVYQGDRATNALIRQTCSSEASGNFFHFNNGITFLCVMAEWDGFTHRLTMRRAQIVNGGQTIRVIHGEYIAGRLEQDVLVPVRVITSQGDKEFSNQVTVNLNNQNRITPGFLRSNDPRVIQLSNSLASKGWYLERRERELKTLTADKRAAIEARIGQKLEGYVIHLKEALQAYVATYLRQPETAKKNPKRIFLGAQDGGIFERIFSEDLTADKLVDAQRLAWGVTAFVKRFMTRKRRKDRVEDWRKDYAELLSEEVVEKHADVLDQVVPQSTIFLCAVVFEDQIKVRGIPLHKLIEALEDGNFSILTETISLAIDFAEAGAGEGKSWPTLLKSQSFFEKFVAYLQGRASSV